MGSFRAGVCLEGFRGVFPLISMVLRHHRKASSEVRCGRLAAPSSRLTVIECIVLSGQVCVGTITGSWECGAAAGWSAREFRERRVSRGQALGLGVGC